MNSTLTITADYLRGQRDAKRFSVIRKRHDSWQVLLALNGTEAWLLDNVTDDYLAGLADGGCVIDRRSRDRRSSADQLFDSILRRIAFLRESRNV